jgi:hypothetical protein
LTVDTADIAVSLNVTLKQMRSIKSALELVLEVSEARNQVLSSTLEGQSVEQMKIRATKQQS